ncbi:MAG TPA: SUMF1/EgtB/PvdO family nonheme iron enzyme [Chthoniobacteraceae bacterium]|nr:SUMF1/EgtB/PvdO family nonheme iron enzyme [Chthoniobacteraceae bacterium]
MPTDEISTPPTSSSSAFAVGQKLAGIYILRDRISDRAEGEIWLAHDEVLGKDISLHFIPNVLRGDTRAMGEIRQEIKRNRQLIHPGILRVYDLVEEPEWSAISMDWFEGESLATALKNKPAGFFEPAEVKPWLQQICHTLDDIHKIQIVHRDVAPHNIFVDARGKVLLAKFGISRVVEDAVARANKGAGPDPRLASVSPQSLDGENPSKADDVYSIGATIYELLTGELPFGGPELLAQIRKNPPQPMAERRAKLGKGGGTIPPAWEKWVAAALAKPTTERPASAGELAAKLGLSGKLAPEPAAPAPAAVAPVAAVVAATAAVATAPEPVSAKAPEAAAPEPASAKAPEATAPEPESAKVPETTVPEPASAKAPEPVSTAAEPVSEKAPESPKETPAAPVETPAASAAATPPAAASHSNDREPEPAAPAEPKVELPPRGSGIKLPPSRFAGAAAAESGRKAVEKSEEKPAEKPADQPAQKPLSLDDDEREVDSKDYADADKDEDRPTPAKSSKLVFAALLVLIGGLAYFLLRSPKEEPKPLTGAPVNAQVTPTPKQVAEATPRLEPATPKKEVGLSGESVLTTPTPPVPATPNLAKPTPVAPPSMAVATSDDPETQYLNAVKQEQEAKAAVSTAVKAVETKGKEITKVVKDGEQLAALRVKRSDEVKAAVEAADAARQAADAKAKAVEDARKAQADWEAANGPKLAAYDKASSDFKALQDALAEKQQQAEAAAKAVAAADKARQDKVALLQKKKDEAARLLAEKAAEEKRIADENAAAEKRRAEQIKAEETRKIDDEIENVKWQLEVLKWKREHPGGEPLPAALAARAPKTQGETPTRVTPIATPGPVSSTPRPIPSPPPSPTPRIQSNIQSEFSATPAVPILPATPTLVAMGSTPPIKNITTIPKATPTIEAPPLIPATPVPAPTEVKATAPEASAGESSLGLKFAPVGDVAFCLWPTRVQDFEVFAKEVGFRNNSWKSPGFKQGPDHPVVNVSWNDAIAFCKWLTERDRKKGFLTKDQLYRLPTDLEWSKAVGLPEETGKTPEARDMNVPDVFPWGTQWPPPPNVGNYTGEETGSDVAIKGYDDGFAWTSPVGTFPANKYGLYDVGGNVWQWCMDNSTNESKAKVLRGASWYNGALKLSLLSSCRVSANPDSSTDNYGFRIVRASESRAGRPR